MKVTRTPALVLSEIESLTAGKSFIYKDIHYCFTHNRIQQKFINEIKDPEDVASYYIEQSTTDTWKNILHITKLKDCDLPDKLIFAVGFIPEHSDISSFILL